MGVIQQHVVSWKWLKKQVAQVPDPILRNAMMAEFRTRALREWGYCPEDGTVAQESDIVLDEWEQDFVADIRDAKKYQMDTRANKREAEQRTTRANMLAFIRDRGALSDIPDNIRTPVIEELYYECLFNIGRDIRAQADNVIATGNHPISVSEIDPFDGKKPTLDDMVAWLRNGGFWFNLPHKMQTKENKELFMRALGQL